MAGGLGALGSLFGGGKQEQEQQNFLTPPIDTGVYAFDPMERYDIGTDYLEALKGQWGQIAGGGGGFSYGGGRAGGSAATASLIDIGDIAFQAEPESGLREDVYNRLASGARAEASQRKAALFQQMRQAGQDPNSPYAQYMANKIDAEAARNSTSGLTSFYDQFVTSALSRRAGALGENAQLGTSASIATAQNRTQASIANAQIGAQTWLGGLGAKQNMYDSFYRASQWAQSPIDHTSILGSGSMQSGGYAPGMADQFAGAAGFIRDVWGGGGDQSGAPYGGAPAMGGPGYNDSPYGDYTKYTPPPSDYVRF